MYTGGIDFRKNFPVSSRRTRCLPDDVRSEHQLVIVCRVLPPEREALMSQARDLGIDDAVLLTGFVPDSTLSLLYQSAALFVFPSIYEGFGLPIAEAVLSGTLAIASDSSSMVELVTDPALQFDPNDPADIARCIADTLDSPEADRRRRRPVRPRHRQFRWERVADRTIEAIDALTARPPARTPSIAGLASRWSRPCRLPNPVSPTTRGGSPTRLAPFADVDLVAEDPDSQSTPELAQGEPDHRPRPPRAGPPPPIRRRSSTSWATARTTHRHTISWTERPGSVMVHEARFAGFFEWYGRHYEDGPEWFHEFLHDEYQGIEPPLGEVGWLTCARGSRRRSLPPRPRDRSAPHAC